MIIDGKKYEVKELTMEQGFAIMSGGELDVPTLIRASITIDGRPAGEGEISMKVAQKLMPAVLKANGLEDNSEGNA
jgi:hypothetical protein